MSGPLRITAEIEGAEAALEMAAMLDELSGAVAAFETREAEGKNPALWRVEAYPRQSVLNAETAPATSSSIAALSSAASAPSTSAVMRMGPVISARRTWIDAVASFDCSLRSRSG